MTTNPFETIDKRLTNIEDLLLEIKHQPKAHTLDAERPLRMKEAAGYLGVSLQTLYGYIMAGKIKPMKAGKFNLFYKADLDQFIQGGQKDLTDATPIYQN